MADILQTTFSNACFWRKTYEYRLRFHWILFLSVKWTIFQYWFRSWLGADEATSHYLIQWCLVYWSIYVSLRLSELIHSEISMLPDENKGQHSRLLISCDILYIQCIQHLADWFQTYKCVKIFSGMRCRQSIAYILATNNVSLWEPVQKIAVFRTIIRQYTP